MAKRRAAGKAAEASGPTNVVEAGITPKPSIIRSKFAGVPMGWEQAAEALPVMVAVRTIFPDFDRKTHVGGLPSERIIVVHGATHGGKTTFVVGLVASFLLGGHAGAYIDAEHATPQEYVRQLIEQVTRTKLEQLGGFFAKRPQTYEDTITDVDRFLGWMKEQRKTNKDLRSIVVVDSLTELTPKRELEQMLKGINQETKEDADVKPAAKGRRGGNEKGGDNISKGWGRVRAGLNAAWISHVVPLLPAAGCSLVLIVQEKEDENESAMPWEVDLMDEYGLKGGGKTKYAASLLLRVVKVKPIKEGEGRDAVVLAWEHKVRIWKSKVGPMDGRWTDCTFYLKLDGTFDMARNLIHTATEMRVMSVSKSWLGFQNVRVNGEKAMVAKLEKDPVLMEALTLAVMEAVNAEIASTAVDG